MDKDPAKNTKSGSESLDFYDPHGLSSASTFFKMNFSSLPSMSYCEVGNDCKGVSQGTMDHVETAPISKINGGININEVYNRKSTLRESSNPENFGVFRRIEQMHATSANEVPAKSSERSETENAEGTGKVRRGLLAQRSPETLQAVPDTLLHLLTGRMHSGDCGRSLAQKPDWLDMDKLRRGQKFAQDNMFATSFAEVLTFMILFSFEDISKPFLITGNSDTPYAAFRRYLSTGLRVRRWYTQDSWTKGTAAHNDILVVRAKHAAVRRRLETSTNEEIDTAAVIPNAWCPAREMLLKDFSETIEAPVIGHCPYTAERNSPDRPKGINQAEMALTQWSFIGLITSFPNHIGIHYATDEDIEAFCHLWRSIGYQLGIEDEFNYCRGTLAEIRQRNQDFIEYWVKPNLREITPEWEHVLRCVVTGLSVVLPGLTYEVALLYLTEILGLKMPRLYASLSYKDWIVYNLLKFNLCYNMKLPGMTGLMNNFLNRKLDEVEKLTDEELEAMRIKLSN